MKKNLLVVFSIGFFFGLFIGLILPNENRASAHEVEVPVVEEAAPESRYSAQYVRNGVETVNFMHPAWFSSNENEPGEPEDIFITDAELDQMNEQRLAEERYSLLPSHTFYTLDALQFDSLEEFCNYVGISTTDVIESAKTLYGEANNVRQISHKAMIVWNLLNRVDMNYGGATTLYQVVTAPGQYTGYSSGYPVTDENLSITIDVIWRWHLEHRGGGYVGRVLPAQYEYFHIDRNSVGGGDNLFFTVRNGERIYFAERDYVEGNPYES